MFEALAKNERAKSFAGFASFMLIALALMFYCANAMDYLAKGLCPPTSFLFGTLHPQIQKYSAVIAALAIANAIHGIIRRHVPFIGSPWQTKVSQPKNAIPSMTMIGVSAFVGALIFGAYALVSTSDFCLLPKAILYRSWPWSQARNYSWQDVAFVRTYCSHGIRTAGEVAFVFEMLDGTTIDIMGGSRSLPQAYPSIVGALNNVYFEFDSSSAQGRCDYPHPELLRSRP